MGNGGGSRRQEHRCVQRERDGGVAVVDRADLARLPAGGLDCWAIDGLPLAMARAIGMVGGLGGGRNGHWPSIGDISNTTLCIVGDDRPLYSRRIQDCAFGRVLDAIMESFDVTLDEAQHLAESEGLALTQETTADDRTSPQRLREAAASSLDELVRQISRTLQFMEMQRRHLQPSRRSG